MKSSERFWTEARFDGPAGWTVLCSCGWRRTATSDAHADALLAEHTAAHEALVEAGVA